MDKDKAWGFPFDKYPEKFKPIYNDKDFIIYENKQVLPRAYLVKKYEVIKEDQKLISRMISSNFDFINTAIINLFQK